MFEADLRFKVDSKCPSGHQEERWLNKSFQFFDFHRTGMLEFIQFHKTLEKIGVVITKSKSEMIFNQIIDIGYGKDGYLDYRAYAQKVYSPSNYEPYDSQVHKPLSTAVYEGEYVPSAMPKEVSQYQEPRYSPAKSVSSHSRKTGPIDYTSDTVETIMEELRQRIKMRGAKGFIGLQRQFKLADTSGIGTINQFEFSKVLREFDLNLLDGQYNVLISAFDKYKTGQIDYLSFKSKFCYLNF
jgi:Ca2+-binding EF-hand superfamily protein